MCLTLALRAPYDFQASVGFWRRSTAELTEQWADGVYRRLVEHQGRTALLTLRGAGTVDAPALLAEAEGLEAGLLERLARQLLNEQFDLAGALAQLGDDPLVGPLLRRYHGLKPTRPPSLWEALVWAICAQQISLLFALRLKQRLVQRFGTTREVAGRPLASFPTPAALAEASVAELQSFQFSGSKAQFIIGLAQAIERGELDLAAIEAMPTPEALAYLTSQRGVGPWTAEYALLRGLGRADAFPAGDAGVRAALVRLGALPPRPTERELRAWAEQIKPWGGVVAIYLWRWASEQ